MRIQDIKKATTNQFKRFPKSWRRIHPYFNPLSQRENFQLNFLSVFVGVGAGFGAIAFRYLIGFLQNTLLHHQLDYHLISPVNHMRGAWIFLILPLGLLFSALLTKLFAPEAKGPGIPEVIEAVWKNSGRIRKRVLVIKSLASGLTIASGGSLGREGPIVQIGSALGSFFAQVLSLKPRMVKTLVGCGAAASVAATFNTPIAGVIFAIEVVILELKTKSFVPLVISSVFATVVSRFYLGNDPAFFVPAHSLQSPQELVAYLILGVLAGVLGVLMIKVLYGSESLLDRFKVPFWIKSIGAGLALAAIGSYYPQVYGVGYETISSVLQQESGLSLMLILIFLKIIAMSLTLVGGGSGGVFAPSLFVGAMLGGSFGYVVHSIFPEGTLTYGAYALVGMAALFSATARASFTAIVIIFEMTLDYSIILPLMFVCVTADQVAWLFSKESIYSLKLRRKGIHFVRDMAANTLFMIPVEKIMTKDPESILLGASVSSLSDKILTYDHSVYPVVDKDKQLLGVISRKKLKKICKEKTDLDLKEELRPAKSVVYNDESVSSALTKIEKVRNPRVFVVDKKSKKLVGLVCPVDFVRLSSAELSEEV